MLKGWELIYLIGIIFLIPIWLYAVIPIFDLSPGAAAASVGSAAIALGLILGILKSKRW